MGAITETLSYLLQTVLSLLLLLVLVRMLLQQSKADFYNPISQFVVKVTNPLLYPLQKVAPGLWGIVALLLLLQVASIASILLFGGYGLPSPPVLLLAWAIIGLAGLLVNFYFFAILAMIVLSWIAPGSANPAVYLLYQLTEPVLAPCRRLLPSMGGLDLSPIVVFIGINVVRIFLRHAAAGVGLHPSLVIGL
jgi:YggT family protein